MKSLYVGRLILLSAVCLLASKSPTFAAITDITIPNFSFEDYDAGVGNGGHYANQNPPNNPGPTGILFTNWVTTSANFQIFQNPISNLGATPGTTQGTYYVDESIPFGTVVTAETENPVATIDNNATYDLTVSLGLQTGKVAPNLTIALLSGNTILASQTVLGSVLDLTAGTFADYNTSFTTLLGNDAGYVGQALSIEIVSSPTGAFQDGEFDNVRLSEVTVPEPGTWALVLLGAAGLVVLGRRRIMA